MRLRAATRIVANEGGERPQLRLAACHYIRMNVAKTSKEPTMTQRIPENYPAADWRLVNIMGSMPPRVPNDDDDDDEDEDEDNDTDDEDQPPVIREPEEDE